MSKSSKSKSKDERRKAKRARKQAMIAKYQKWRDESKNNKSKRSMRKGSAKKLSTISHPDGKCGNIGCTKCFSINFKPFLVDGVPHKMPHRMYIRWQALA